MSSRQRVSPEVKLKAVLRVLGGETLESVSSDVGVSRARITRWEQVFTEGGRTALKKDAETRGRGFLYRHRAAIAQWIVLLLILLAATMLLTRFIAGGEGV